MTAARQGLEPRFPGPKPGVLPLDDQAIKYCKSDTLTINRISRPTSISEDMWKLVYTISERS